MSPPRGPGPAAGGLAEREVCNPPELAEPPILGIHPTAHRRECCAPVRAHDVDRLSARRSDHRNLSKGSQQKGRPSGRPFCVYIKKTSRHVAAIFSWGWY